MPQVALNQGDFPFNEKPAHGDGGQHDQKDDGHYEL
jgi:hypothetical protein